MKGWKVPTMTANQQQIKVAGKRFHDGNQQLFLIFQFRFRNSTTDNPQQTTSNLNSSFLIT